MYQKMFLPNGLRIATHPMKQRDSVGVGIWVAAGGRYESDAQKGVAHFLEHMLFKGSRKYSCEEIKERIEGVGGALNAFTAEEKTCYYAKIPSRHLAQTFDILGDMVIAPLMDEKEIAKERSVILEEIKMYQDLPQHLVLDFLDELVWPGHPLGKSLAGTPETVAGLSPADLRGFHQRFYRPAQMTVTACGDVSHQKFVRLAGRKFSKGTGGPVETFRAASNEQCAPRAKFHRKDIEQMHLALGMLALPEEHEDRYALYLLHVILGGNMSSRLFDEIREKRGLAYSIGTTVKPLYDTGMFMVRAGVDNHKIVDAVDVILRELAKISSAGVGTGEFRRAKEYYLGQLLLGLEDTLEHMLWIGDVLSTHHKTRTLSQVVKAVHQVTLKDITRVAREILRPQRFNLAIVGPITDAQEKKLSSLMGL